MLVNKDTVIVTPSIILVPYEKSHVPTYHEWMKDEEIQQTTASEPLTLEEEFAMQASWRTDHDKLTFIVCKSSSSSTKEEYDDPDDMIGDVNLFLTPADEDEEGCVAELELMIASPSNRRKGYGRAAILAFMKYIRTYLDEILDEYRKGVELGSSGDEKMRLLMLRVKIGGRNVGSLRLFESLGFVKVDESPNYFGEFELVLEGWLTGKGVEGYEERVYESRH